MFCSRPPRALSNHTPTLPTIPRDRRPPVSIDKVRHSRATAPSHLVRWVPWASEACPCSTGAAPRANKFAHATRADTSNELRRSTAHSANPSSRSSLAPAPTPDAMTHTPTSDLIASSSPTFKEGGAPCRIVTGTDPSLALWARCPVRQAGFCPQTRFDASIIMLSHKHDNR